MKCGLLLRVSLALVATAAAQVGAQDAPRPNVIVLLSDDAGWGDFGFQGSQLIPTPHLDSIAARGVRLLQGYVTASVCSPSRAGLLTGRYQQRFGHEHNFAPDSPDSIGLPLGQRTLADALSDRGYRTIGLGKWHLGYGAPMHPLERGFDHWFGFLAGSRSYWKSEGKPRRALQRDGVEIEEDFEYMTDLLGEESAAYIEANSEQPFFLFLSFNAPHSPMHALERDLARIDEATQKRRRKYAAMTVAMDRAVGRLLTALGENGLVERTLLFFVNDNGGAWNNASDNAPLRGTKGTPFEGGLRVPFLVQWPGTLPAGEDYPWPISTLDIFATAMAAAGGRATDEMETALDGVDLLPFLTGQRQGRPHRELFWRRKQNSAARVDDWKLVTYKNGAPMLFDLAQDPLEQVDLAARHQEIVARLAERLAAWQSELIPPAWTSSATDPK